MAVFRIGLLVLLIYALPTPVIAGGGPFSPCGTPGWFGFSLALPIPRLPHLHTFASSGYQSPMCAGSQYPNSSPCGCGLFGNPCGYGAGCGLGCGCGVPGFAPPPSYLPPMTPPSYSPPMMMPQPSFPSTGCNPCDQSFAQMQYLPQQTVSYQDVPQIQYRQEPYTASLPVTTYQQVTGYRNVPYQTTARIPQISTQYVPQMTVSAPCSTCQSGITSLPFSPTASTLGVPYSPTPTPQTATIPEYPYPAAQPQTTASDDWQTIPQRQAATPTEVQQMGYFPSSSSGRPHSSTTRSMFRPAPSAASAWQSPWLR